MVLELFRSSTELLPQDLGWTVNVPLLPKDVQAGKSVCVHRTPQMGVRREGGTGLKTEFLLRFIKTQDSEESKN